MAKNQSVRIRMSYVSFQEKYGNRPRYFVGEGEDGEVLWTQDEDEANVFEGPLLTVIAQCAEAFRFVRKIGYDKEMVFEEV